MKRRGVSAVALTALAVALISVIIVYALKQRVPPEAAGAIEARIELAAGDVTVSVGGAEQRAHGPQALRAGSKVRVGKGARVLLRLPDGSSIFLRGDTEVELAEDGVMLHRGEYWLDAPSGARRGLVHRIGDVGVTAEDAGASLRRDEGSVSVYVARGMAVVTGAGGRVEVDAGELAEVRGADAPKVEPIAFWDDWTGGMADFGASVATVAAGNGEILAVDAAGTQGTPAERLQINSQTVRAVIRDGLAETEVDQTFFNPASRPVEGWYWFSIPEGAIVTSFAVETNGQLIEGEFIERREAAGKYTGAKQSGHAPAILEWIDSQTYRARIFPIMPSQTRRVVLRYLELLPTGTGKLAYVYPMASRSAQRIGEFALTVDLGSDGKKMEVATLAEARIENGGEQVTMRRSGFTPRVDFQLEAVLPAREPGVRVSRFEPSGDAAAYVMARYVPEVDWEANKPRADIVLVVDTSAGADEATRRLEAAVAESILRALSAEDRFALITLDVEPRVLHPKDGLAPADDDNIARALETLSEHVSGGATDLASVFDVALSRVHEAAQPAVIYVGDGVATSGEQTGEQIIERLRRSIGSSRARLFTVAVGSDADTSLLSELARAGGGTSLSVSDAQFATAAALQLAANFKVPTLTDFELDLGAGLDEPMSNVSGKVARGNEVVVLARTHHDLPSTVAMRARLGDATIERELKVTKDASVVSAFVPKLWAAAHVRRLLGASVTPSAPDGAVAPAASPDSGRIAALGIDYGLMTPYTSVLALESEAAFSSMGIQRRRSPLRGVKLTAIDRATERTLLESLALGDQPVTSAFGCNEDGNIGAAPAPPRHEADDVSPATVPEPQYGIVGDQDKPTDAQPATGEAGKGRAFGGGETEAGALARDGLNGKDAIAADPTAAGGNAWGADINGRLGRKMPQPSGVCSALARRPLAQRALVWASRLRTASGPDELIQRYVAAQWACEITDWRAEQTLLDLLQRHIDSEAGAKMLLSALAGRHDVQHFVAKLILRRAVDERMVAAVEEVLFGAGVDWIDADRILSEIEDVDERVAKLRELMARAPDDPNGIIRLVELLASTGRVDEALAMGRRLRDRGLLTVRVVRQLGDVLARSGKEEEAIRTYSEIVEFDASSADSRMLLGDIYLSRGWFDPAYRQYRQLADANGDAMAWLRLAHAASGAGRVDEALRIDRQVASAQGRPGPDDPRRWARLASAARVARLLAAPPKDTPPEALQRKLKELQLFQGESTLVIVTWSDLTSDVALTTTVGDTEAALGEAIDAAPIGLAATMLSRAELDRSALVGRLRSVPRKEALVLDRHDVSWDGKAFVVRVSRVELPAGSTRVSL